VSSCWPYTHDKFEDEIFMENAQDWDKVVARMVDPKITNFRAMSLDEQTTTIEQLDQEAVISREEMIAAKATVPQVVTEATKIPPIARYKTKVSIWHQMHGKGGFSC
jgi:hypothetical protein